MFKFIALAGVFVGVLNGATITGGARIQNSGCTFNLIGSFSSFTCSVDGTNKSIDLLYFGSFTISGSPGSGAVVLPYTYSVASATDSVQFAYSIGTMFDGTISLGAPGPIVQPQINSGSFTIPFLNGVSVGDGLSFDLSANTYAPRVGHSDITVIFGVPTINGMTLSGSLIPTPEPSGALLASAVLLLGWRRARNVAAVAGELRTPRQIA